MVEHTYQETPDHELVRKSVGAVAAGFGHAYFRERSAADARAHELWEALATGGFTSVNLPEEFGGGGGGITELAIVVEEVAAQGCPLLLLIVSPAICGSIISRFGTDEQRAHWLPKLSGAEDPRWKMAFAITEEGAGSNSHRLSTTATRDGDAWVLQGSKTFISGVDEAGAILVVARTGVDEASGKGKLSIFIVDVDAPGLEARVIETEVVAPEKQYALFFDDVVVGADRLVGVEGEGLQQVFAGLNPERITGQRCSTASAAMPSTARPRTRASARCGTCRSAATRASPTRWRRRRSTSSWPA